jgi:hypothetical protein
MPVPWVCVPSYNDDREAWVATIRGAYLLGVREFLYWTPQIKQKQPDDDAFVAELVAELRRMDEVSAAAFD